MELSKSRASQNSRSNLNLSYTEIWSIDGESKNIQLAEPKLDSYSGYLELMLVDTNYCVKP